MPIDPVKGNGINTWGGLDACMHAVNGAPGQYKHATASACERSCIMQLRSAPTSSNASAWTEPPQSSIQPTPTLTSPQPPPPSSTSSPMQPPARPPSPLSPFFNQPTPALTSLQPPPPSSTSSPMQPPARPPSPLSPLAAASPNLPPSRPPPTPPQPPPIPFEPPPPPMLPPGLPPRPPPSWLMALMAAQTFYYCDLTG